MISVHQPHEFQHEVRRAAGGPFRMGRRCPGGFRRRPPPSQGGASGLVVLDNFTDYQGSNGSTAWTSDGILRFTHEIGAGANRLAVLFFSMRHVPTADNPDPGPDLSFPPATVMFGSQAMTFIDFRATSLVFHGFYFLQGITQTGSVTVSFNPVDDDARWWCMLHCFTFRGARQIAPSILTEASGSRSAPQSNPYQPIATTSVAGSWVLDSISTDEDQEALTTPLATAHTKRTGTSINTNDGENAWTRAHALACGTEEHATIDTYAHPWWWPGSMAFTYYAVEIRPPA